MFEWLLLFCMFLLSVSIVVAVFRLIKGPSMSDRVLSLDSIGYNIIGIVTVLTVMMKTQAFLEIILLIGIIAFLGTIALSKFVERGVVIEYNRDE
ncbi:Na(+)/H(+) antiporter subunit F1 [Xylanibacillus composti]|uniref:Na(+)/H(+) antiporter subunit F n=1 Tax=Xylanibacillus composti TaxID=1572762 RepID=A0A8J4M2M9_9BACL|nr:Na(+)/H(+) antiporter subunit F1 [Xylanibacillus composti]MDT9725336.1 Na(+)/H(+) antiporter subunit F1 [Xylanibacillus composti]GIQ69097.1 Na(+)/H(+) antiporter subunit F [Xylanibacillus composti]